MEIRLALLPPGTATCPQYCKFLTVLSNSLIVTTHHIAYRVLIRSIAQHLQEKNDKLKRARSGIQECVERPVLRLSYPKLEQVYAS
jgi:hypothetical protein